METSRRRQGGISRTMKTKKDSLLLLLLGILAVLAVPLAESSECFPCESRQKQTKTENCTNTEDDCGNCLEGLQEYSWTPYNFCGKKVVMSYGTITVLWCQFEEPVNCIWQRNDFQVDNLDFVGDSNSTNTTSCSIQINVTEETVGTWDCKSEAEADTDAIQGSHIVVSLKLKATVIEGPSNASLHSGDNTTLTCIFDMPVTCFWMHNGTRTRIADRYKTSDCSINITDFHAEDSGEWTCGSDEDSSLEEVISATSWLTWLIEPSESVPAANDAPEWIIVVAVIVSIGALIVVISIVLACIYGCGSNYKAVSQKEYELGETRNGRPPVLLTD